MPPYSLTEIACLLAHADRCIYFDLKYSDTIAVEIRKISDRRVTWGVVRNKLTAVLKTYYVEKPYLPQLLSFGTGCIDLKIVPVEICAEMDRMRSTWQMPPLDMDAGLPAATGEEQVPSEDSFSTVERAVLDSGTDSRKKTHYVEETPEQQEDDMTIIKGNDNDDDDAASPMTSPFSSPTPASPIEPAPLKRSRKRGRSSSPEDFDDDDFEPDLEPKRRRPTEGSSSHARGVSKGATKPKGKGVTVLANKRATIPPNKGLARNGRTTKPGHQTADTSITSTSYQDDDVSQRKPGPEPRNDTSGRARTVSVVDLDSLPGYRSRSGVGSPAHVSNTDTTPPESTEDTINPRGMQTAGPSSRATGKRKALDTREDGDFDAESLPKKQKTDTATLEPMKEMISACFHMISNLITHQHGPPEERIQHFHQLIRTFEDLDGSKVDDLLKDLDSQRALKAKYRDMIKKLVSFVDVSEGPVFPKTPAQKEVAKSWRGFYEQIVSMVGLNNVKPTPTPAGAGYLTCAVEAIAQGRIGDDQLEVYIDNLGSSLKSPHAQQTLISALFCRWVFASSEPMLATMHSDSMKSHYIAIMSTSDTDAEGLAKAQHHDKVVTQLQFADPDFQAVHVSRRTEHLKSRFETAKAKRCHHSDIPSKWTAGKFAKHVVEFKQQLLLSPREYRIRFARPGSKFNPVWMQAVDEDNEPISDADAAGKQITLCTFPALTSEEPEAIREGSTIEDVLCKNKRFFPGFMELLKNGPGTEVSKARVLVL